VGRRGGGESSDLSIYLSIYPLEEARRREEKRREDQRKKKYSLCKGQKAKGKIEETEEKEREERDPVLVAMLETFALQL
jgi:hypothetical protein